MNKIIFIVGTRPELIKIRSVLLEVIIRDLEYSLIHTGQHYDFNMSDIFFNELGLPLPNKFLGISSGTQAEQISDGLIKLEKILLEENPSLVVVLGDTNTTLIGALSGIKLGIPIVHIEAGVRSFDMSMPEEINRRIVDSISTICFAPTKRAMNNLKNEGRGLHSYLGGDTLVETALFVRNLAIKKSNILEKLNLKPKEFILVTSHRKENVDNINNARNISDSLSLINTQIVYPIHPRTKKMYKKFGFFSNIKDNILLIDPVGYFDFITLLNNAKLIMTDSGGVQQEASIFNIPCVTMRSNTEWIETVEAGKNKLVGTDKIFISKTVNLILEDQNMYKKMVEAESPFKIGASKKIVNQLEKSLLNRNDLIKQSNFLHEGLPK